MAVAVGALAVTFAITAATGIAGSFGDGPDVDAAVAALPVLLGRSGGGLGGLHQVGHHGADGDGEASAEESDIFIGLSRTAPNIFGNRE